MNIVRWEPFREITSLRDAMDRLFEDSFVRVPQLWSAPGIRELPVDMHQTDNDLVIKASLPGFKPEDVDISITDGTNPHQRGAQGGRGNQRGELLL